MADSSQRPEKILQKVSWGHCRVDQIVNLIKQNLDPGYTEDFFRWKHLDSPFGKSFVYIFNRSVKNMNIISNGDWIEYKKNNIIKNLCQL